ncbi:hypothetical protein PJL18_03199 [Paenarthrobacter nicotinovorans]|nr:hypothetical protein [Paenarthrobacter nicotinovorans]
MVRMDQRGGHCWSADRWRRRRSSVLAGHLLHQCGSGLGHLAHARRSSRLRRRQGQDEADRLSWGVPGHGCFRRSGLRVHRAGTHGMGESAGVGAPDSRCAGHGPVLVPRGQDARAHAAARTVQDPQFCLGQRRHVGHLCRNIPRFLRVGNLLAAGRRAGCHRGWHGFAPGHRHPDAGSLLLWWPGRQVRSSMVHDDRSVAVRCGLPDVPVRAGAPQLLDAGAARPDCLRSGVGDARSASDGRDPRRCSADGSRNRLCRQQRGCPYRRPYFDRFRGCDCGTGFHQARAVQRLGGDRPAVPGRRGGVRRRDP